MKAKVGGEMDMATLKRFVELSIDIKEKSTALKALEREKRELEEPITNMLAEDGIASIKILGYTVYLHTQIWVGAKDMVSEEGEVVGKDYGSSIYALKQAGHADLIETRFSTQRVSALIREMDKSEDGIPEILQENLKITEKVQPRARKA
jgi:hypothetical protein